MLTFVSALVLTFSSFQIDTYSFDNELHQSLNIGNFEHLFIDGDTYLPFNEVISLKQIAPNEISLQRNNGKKRDCFNLRIENNNIVYLSTGVDIRISIEIDTVVVMNDRTSTGYNFILVDDTILLNGIFIY
jgi:hypothetical protein